MEKLIYLLGDTEAGALPKGRDDLREKILAAAPALEAAGACDVTKLLPPAYMAGVLESGRTQRL